MEGGIITGNNQRGPKLIMGVPGSTFFLILRKSSCLYSEVEKKVKEHAIKRPITQDRRTGLVSTG